MLPTGTRFLRGLLRRALCGCRTGSDLSAGTAYASSRSTCAGRPASSQCRHAHSRHRSRSAAASASLLAGQVDDTGTAIESVATLTSAATDARDCRRSTTQTPRPSSSTRQAAPAIPRASCSATPICSPISARIGTRARCKLRRRFRQLASALPRSRPDRRRGSAACISRRRSMSCRRSASWCARQAGCGRSIDFAPRCRRRPISASSCAPTRSTRRYRGPRSELAAHRGEWCRAGERADAAPLQRRV